MILLIYFLYLKTVELLTKSVEIKVNNGIAQSMTNVKQERTITLEVGYE